MAKFEVSQTKANLNHWKDEQEEGQRSPEKYVNISCGFLFLGEKGKIFLVLLVQLVQLYFHKRNRDAKYDVLNVKEAIEEVEQSCGFVPALG